MVPLADPSILSFGGGTPTDRCLHSNTFKMNERNAGKTNTKKMSHFPRVLIQANEYAPTTTLPPVLLLFPQWVPQQAQPLHQAQHCVESP